MKGVRIPADMGDELEDAHWNLRLSEQAIIIMALDDFLVANGFRKKKKHGQTKR